jgi:hypothetical protein
MMIVWIDSMEDSMDSIDEMYGLQYGDSMDWIMLIV